MNIIFWVLEGFFVLIGIVCVKAIYFPQAHAMWTLERVRSEMKFYGFEGEIKTTDKSVARIRNGHILVLLAVMLFMVVVKMLLK